MSPYSIDLPPYVATVLDRLHARGHSAYVVGGSLRDLMLGGTPHDWDVTTSARPEQTLEAFSDFTTIPTGLQHGTVTVHTHCINVAKYSLMLADKLKIRVRRRELIRGALLHDYFLYDWHDKNHINPFKLHGFFHPGRALKNAIRDFELTEREQDIIRKHMWPMTIIPPKCREAWIVTAADKWVSLLETLRIHK